MKKIHYSSSSSSSDGDSSSSSSDGDSSSSEEEIRRSMKTIKNNNKKPKPQENGNPNGKNPVIEQQPPIIIGCDNMDKSVANPADVKVYPDSYVYEIDMPGLKSGGEIKVEVEDDDYLVISGERKRKEGVEYLRTERKVGKFMRRFVLPKNANAEAVSAICQDGVLSVTVQKFPAPKNPRKTIQVLIG